MDAMRIGMQLGYSGGFKETVEELIDYERAGLDIASGILNTYTRTPTLMAMTAAGVDYVSDGRFTLGLGASGPQVIEGFHGVPYTAPLGRTREVIEICRQVWRRERLTYEGRHYTVPLPEGQGT